eukprot:1195459-Prorocentrum_minimum.AAC.4
MRGTSRASRVASTGLRCSLLEAVRPPLSGVQGDVAVSSVIEPRPEMRWTATSFSVAPSLPVLCAANIVRITWGENAYIPGQLESFPESTVRPELFPPQCLLRHLIEP